MQVPEKLALIGGSILLSSTLIFTLKSQASSIIPSVGHSISNVFDHIGDAQKSSDFNSNYQEAQQGGRKTGTWGTAKWYIDKDDNLHIGSGKLQSNLWNNIGEDAIHQIKTVNFDSFAQAPQDSSQLLAGAPNILTTVTSGSSNITAINGLENLDTSQATNMQGMFANNNDLKYVNLSNLNTSNATNVKLMFSNDYSIPNYNIKNWNVSKVKTMEDMFNENNSITSLNLSHWNTSNVNNMELMFAYSSNLRYLNISSFNTNQVQSAYYTYQDSNALSSITLGQDTKNPSLSNTGLINSTWKNGNQSLSSYDLQGNISVPGTWIRQ